VSETDKLALQTADLALKTDRDLDRTARRVNQLADGPGERVREASLATQLSDWAVARLSPRRRRSDKIAAFDARVSELEARRGELLRQMGEARDRIPAAEDEYAARLTCWHAEGGKGARPESPVPALEAEARALGEDYEALAPLIGEALAGKTAYVESNRDALERDAAAAVEEAAGEYRAAVDRLVQAREELVAARRDELWTKLFPDPSLQTEPPATALVGGAIARLRTVVPGLAVTIGVPELRRLLEADADFIARMLTPQQQEALRARDPDALRHDRDAIWTATEAGQEALRKERQEARERYRREWGQAPNW
jgi:hypothetical protein